MLLALNIANLFNIQYIAHYYIAYTIIKHTLLYNKHYILYNKHYSKNAPL